MGAPYAKVPELLTPNNYGKWKIWMKNYLLGKDLWDIVEGTEPRPDQATQATEFSTWRKKNGRALYAMQVSCGDEAFEIISMMDLAKAAWDALKTFESPLQEQSSTEKPTEISELTSVSNPPENSTEITGSTSLPNPTTLKHTVISRSTSWPTRTTKKPTRTTLERTEISRSTSSPTRGNAGRLLHKAVVKGDSWEQIDKLIKGYGEDEALSARLSMGETILHTAIIHKHLQLVGKLVKMPNMSIDVLKCQLPYRWNGTSLHLAVYGGNVNIATALVEGYDNLLSIRDDHGGNVNIAKALVDRDHLLSIEDSHGYLPVTKASYSTGDMKMLSYLYEKSKDYLNRSDQIRNGITILINAIAAEEYGFALDIIKDHPQLLTARNSRGTTALIMLAQMPSAFPSGNKLNLWQTWIYKCINKKLNDGNSEGREQSNVAHWLKEQAWNAAKFLVPGLIKQIINMKLKNKQAMKLLEYMSEKVSALDASEEIETIVVDAMIKASELGNVEFVVEMVNSNAAWLWIAAQEGLFQVAVEHRQEKIWELISSLGMLGSGLETFVDSKEETLLHKASSRAPDNRLKSVPGAAMQMQRELQWFKAVEASLPPLSQVWPNKKEEVPRVLFTKQHENLVKEGEKWMKDTASSCMLVATLIATVVFAAAFQVPGGNDSQRGIPICLQKTFFMLFIVADALSLFSSTTSILMFLSILTSRYAEEDFLKSLPKLLIIGLTTLFFSIATMMMAFSAAIIIVLSHRYKWVAIPALLLAVVPVSFFAFLQFPLFVDMVSSTYGSNIIRVRTKSQSNLVLTQPTEGRHSDPCMKC